MPRPKDAGRYVTVYAPNELECQAWVREAKEAGLSLSEWINEMITRAKHKSKPSSTHQVNDSSELQAENAKLRERLDNKDYIIEKQKTELLKLRQASFLDPKPLSGLVQFDCQLVKLLNSGGVWTQEAICSTLHINIQDSDAMKIVSRQLQELRKFKLVEETSRGWRWIK